MSCAAHLPRFLFILTPKSNSGGYWDKIVVWGSELLFRGVSANGVVVLGAKCNWPFFVFSHIHAIQLQTIIFISSTSPSAFLFTLLSIDYNHLNSYGVFDALSILNLSKKFLWCFLKGWDKSSCIFPPSSLCFWQLW